MDDIEKIADFVIKYLHYFDREKIKGYIREHLKYGTCDYAFDKDGEVIYVARWNIEGLFVKVLDFAVAEKYRKKKFIKYVLFRNLMKHLPKFPQVRFISWERDQKYPGREKRFTVFMNY